MSGLSGRSPTVQAAEALGRARFAVLEALRRLDEAERDWLAVERELRSARLEAMSLRRPVPDDPEPPHKPATRCPSPPF